MKFENKISVKLGQKVTLNLQKYQKKKYYSLMKFRYINVLDPVLIQMTQLS